MKQSQRSKTNAAEKALERAIAEETAHLYLVIRQKDAEIGRLHNFIGQIGNIVAAVPKPEGAALAPVVPVVLPQVEEAPLPDGPKVELSGADDMGEGRWA